MLKIIAQTWSLHSNKLFNVIKQTEGFEARGRRKYLTIIQLSPPSRSWGDIPIHPLSVINPGVLFTFLNLIVSVYRRWKTTGEQKSFIRSCFMNSFTAQAITAVLPAKGL